MFNPDTRFSMRLPVILLLIWVNALQVTSQSFSGIQEEAVIVAYGGDLPSNHTLSNATKLSLVCAAFGRPSPEITWESHDQIINVTNSLNSTVNISSFVINQSTDFEYVVSVLQLCGVTNVSELSSYKCTASNGVQSEPAIGVASVTFFAFNDIDTTFPINHSTDSDLEPTTTTDSNTTSELDSSTESMPVPVMNAVLIVVIVLICVVTLSTGLIISSVLLGLRRCRRPASPTVVFTKRGHSESRASRTYINSLYMENLNGPQAPEKKQEDLYVCDAYEGVTMTTEGQEELNVCNAYESIAMTTGDSYAYVAAPSAVQGTAGDLRIPTQPCPAYKALDDRAQETERVYELDI